MLQQAWVLSKKVPSIEDQSILGDFLFMLGMRDICRDLRPRKI